MSCSENSTSSAVATAGLSSMTRTVGIGLPCGMDAAQAAGSMLRHAYARRCARRTPTRRHRRRHRRARARGRAPRAGRAATAPARRPAGRSRGSRGSSYLLISSWLMPKASSMPEHDADAWRAGSSRSGSSAGCAPRVAPSARRMPICCVRCCTQKLARPTMPQRGDQQQRDAHADQQPGHRRGRCGSSRRASSTVLLLSSMTMRLGPLRLSAATRGLAAPRRAAPGR